MESFRALKAIHGAAALRHDSLTGDGVFKLHSQLSGHRTCAFALMQRDLDQLATKAGGTILDRGGKSRPKSLAYYLRRRSGLVRVRAGYRDPGQTERGIRALLASEDIRPQGAAFFIGLDDDLFEQLWQRAAPDALVKVPPSKIEATGDHDEFQKLLDQNPRITVPDELKQRFVGESPAAEAVRKRILLATRNVYPVLIEGETGTGKEVVARAIHDLSLLVSANFFPVNCGGIATELLESELFGHKKGAFTGALRDKTGLWTLARNGTLFLDEIGDLDPRHQVKVLRALEDGKYRQVGGVKEINSNARVIAATNRDLKQMVATGTFREDLFYRLFNLRIRTPALREHSPDIPGIALHFWPTLAGENAPAPPREVLRELTTYTWPGNARELRAFLANLAALADGDIVTLPMVRAVWQDRLGPMFSSGNERRFMSQSDSNKGNSTHPHESCT